MSWTEATWYRIRKGKKQTIKGRWIFNWAAQRFTIQLDGKDPITGLERGSFQTTDDPEFTGWKLVEEKSKRKKK